jgi:DNA-binding Lrp family transcriptional regulator
MENLFTFVPIPNSMFDDSTKKISPDELFIYVHLHQMITRGTGTAIFSLSMLNALFSLYKKKEKNMEAISEAILSLSRKGYFQLSTVDIKKSPCVEASSFQEPKDNFTKIKYSMLYDVASTFDFMILSYILKVKRPVSYLEFAKVLNCSERTASRHVNQMVEDKILDKDKGKYYIDEYGRLRQYINSYFYLEKETVSDDSKKPIEVYEENTSKEITWGNWKKGSLTHEDFILYCEQEHIHDFKIQCEQKMSFIKEKYNKTFDVEIEEAKRILERRKAQSQRQRVACAINAVVIDGQDVVLSKDNVDTIILSNVTGFYTYQWDEENEDYEPIYADIKKLSSVGEVDEKTQQLAFQHYLQLVRKDIRLTTDELQQLRSSVHTITAP